MCFHAIIAVEVCQKDSENCDLLTNDLDQGIQCIHRVCFIFILLKFVFTEVLNDIDWSLNDLEQTDPKLIDIIRTKYLIGPENPVKAYNFTDRKSKKLLTGQFGQAATIDDEIFDGKKKKGFFIEVMKRAAFSSFHGFDNNFYLT